MTIIIDTGPLPPFPTQDFRAAFPEFADTTKYPDSQINFWLSLGTKLMDPYRWGDLLPYGLMLWVAHQLALEAMATASAGAGGGGVPGLILGNITSASVDKVSYSRQAFTSMDPKNGHWNLTAYGLRWLSLVKMVGAGPVQVGAPQGPGGWQAGNTPQGAWPGVIFPPANQ